MQQIRNNKNRTIVSPTTFALICYLTWQVWQYVNGTLEEWVKKSDGEFAAIEEEIREIRQLLADSQTESLAGDILDQYDHKQ